jgi:hypothetical protein
MEFTADIIKTTADKIKVDISNIDMDQILKGMRVELEHGTKNDDKNLDVTHDNVGITLKIVLAHLIEVPDYYTKLAKYVENETGEKVEERYKLQGFDTHSIELTEDGEAPAAGGAFATLGDIGGMGAPVLANRGVTGSGDIPGTSFGKKKKKAKRVKSFTQFIGK